VPVEDRIATFDQDGTLWVEHPLYTQGEFALACLRSLAPAHPEWKKDEPFRTALSRNVSAVADGSGEAGRLVGRQHEERLEARISVVCQIDCLLKV
jgi:hypothetical protein